jgi:hypothetical protein
VALILTTAEHVAAQMFSIEIIVSRADVTFDSPCGVAMQQKITCCVDSVKEIFGIRRCRIPDRYNDIKRKYVKLVTSYLNSEIREPVLGIKVDKEVCKQDRGKVRVKKAADMIIFEKALKEFMADRGIVSYKVFWEQFKEDNPEVLKFATTQAKTVCGAAMDAVLGKPIKKHLHRQAVWNTNHSIIKLGEGGATVDQICAYQFLDTPEVNYRESIQEWLVSGCKPSKKRHWRKHTIIPKGVCGQKFEQKASVHIPLESLKEWWTKIAISYTITESIKKSVVSFNTIKSSITNMLVRNHSRRRLYRSWSDVYRVREIGRVLLKF